MGYDIYIGQRIDDPDRGYTVAIHEDPAAPTFPNDDMTGHGNSRHPGYITWHKWVTLVGLHDLFFDPKDGLMREHPGTVPLTGAHAWRIRQACVDFEAAHPGTTPRFARFDYQAWQEIEPATDEEVALARLIWLDWWVRWALDHCTAPAIHNH